MPPPAFPVGINPPPVRVYTDVDTYRLALFIPSVQFVCMTTRSDGIFNPFGLTDSKYQLSLFMLNVFCRVSSTYELQCPLKDHFNIIKMAIYTYALGLQSTPGHVKITIGQR